jgi:hypothetical protein
MSLTYCNKCGERVAEWVAEPIATHSPHLLPRNVLHGWLSTDLGDDGIQGLRHLAVLGEQFLDLRMESRLLLEDRSHVPALLLETEMIGSSPSDRWRRWTGRLPCSWGG